MVLLVGVCIEELELFEVFLAGFSLNGGLYSHKLESLSLQVLKSMLRSVYGTKYFLLTHSKKVL